MKVNMDDLIHQLERLINIPSPTGYTENIVKFIEAELHRLNIPTKRIQKGGLLATVAGTDTQKHRLVSAHVDTLGAMVKEVHANGKLKLSLIGGFTFNAIEGEYCQIHTLDGQTFSGTIHLSKTSVHIHRDTKLIERSEDNMEVRVDAPVKNPEDVTKLGIQVGDFISFNPRFTKADHGYIKSRHLDAKAPAACLLAVLKHISESREMIPHTTHFFFSNNEEIGFGGNSNITKETLEYVAVDIGISGMGQASDEFSVSICAKDSGGPYHYGLRKHLTALAAANKIDYKVDIFPNYASDVTSAMLAGYDLKHGLIGPGVDSSHAMERTHQDALANTTKLVFAYLVSPMIDQ
jgi:putative aminopeptidase FrvX